jgi:hypothetical protein
MSFDRAGTEQAPITSSQKKCFQLQFDQILRTLSGRMVQKGLLARLHQTGTHELSACFTFVGVPSLHSREKMLRGQGSKGHGV